MSSWPDNREYADQEIQLQYSSTTFKEITHVISNDKTFYLKKKSEYIGNLYLHICSKASTKNLETTKYKTYLYDLIAVKTSYVYTYLQSINETTASGEFEWARGVAVASNGDRIVVDWKLDRVSVFDKTGMFQCLLRSSLLGASHTTMERSPYDVAITHEGDIVVVYESCSAYVFNKSREYVERICAQTEEEERQNWLTTNPTRTSSVAVDHEGK